MSHADKKVIPNGRYGLRATCCQYLVVHAHLVRAGFRRVPPITSDRTCQGSDGISLGPSMHAKSKSFRIRWSPRKLVHLPANRRCGIGCERSPPLQDPATRISVTANVRRGEKAQPAGSRCAVEVSGSPRQVARVEPQLLDAEEEGWSGGQYEETVLVCQCGRERGCGGRADRRFSNWYS